MSLASKEKWDCHFNSVKHKYKGKRPGIGRSNPNQRWEHKNIEAKGVPTHAQATTFVPILRLFCGIFHRLDKNVCWRVLQNWDWHLVASLSGCLTFSGWIVDNLTYISAWTSGCSVISPFGESAPHPCCGNPTFSYFNCFRVSFWFLFLLHKMWLLKGLAKQNSVTSGGGIIWLLDIFEDSLCIAEELCWVFVNLWGKRKGLEQQNTMNIRKKTILFWFPLPPALLSGKNTGDTFATYHFLPERKQSNVDCFW